MATRARSRPVKLDCADRRMLIQLTRTGSHPAQEVRRARILLELDENDPNRGGPVTSNSVIAERLAVATDTIVRVTKAYTDRDSDVTATIRRKKRLSPPLPRLVTGEIEARTTAKACNQPPAAYERWSLRLLEKHISLTDDIPDLGHSTFGRVLENTAPSSSEAVLDAPGPGHRRVRRQGGRYP